jgi:type I restriction enzyme S subunit
MIEFHELFKESVKNGVWKTADFIGRGIPYVKMNQIFSKRFITSEDDYELIQLNEKEKEKLILHNNDLLFSRTSVVPEGVGSCSIVQGLTKELAFDSNIIRVRLDQSKCYAKYIFYYYNSHIGRGEVLSIANGAAIKTIKGSDINKLKLAPPPLPIQKRIAEILAAYDDLLENNLKRIKLLEELAQRTYEEWFVKFRVNGVQLPMDEISGLPVGWKLVTCFEAMDILSGGTPKTNIPEYWDGNIQFFTPKDATLFSYTDGTEKLITDIGLKKCNAKLFSIDTVFITARGTVGKLNLALEPMAMNQSCYALIGKDYLSQYFLYNSLSNTINQFKGAANGGVFDAIVVDTFRYLKFTKPTKEHVLLFDEFAKPIYEQIKNIITQNRLLRDSRDMLLPRLMNGSITVTPES